jgi:hypothetical protein
VRSAGAAPGVGINPAIAQVLAERGLDVTGSFRSRSATKPPKRPTSSSPWAAATGISIALIMMT